MSEFSDAKKRAAANGDVDALFSIAEQEREAEREAVKERARELAALVKSDEAEAVKLRALRVEHEEVLSEKAEKMRRCADALQDAGEEHALASFNVSTIDAKLASLHDRLTARRRELTRLFDGVK